MFPHQKNLNSIWTHIPPVPGRWWINRPHCVGEMSTLTSTLLKKWREKHVCREPVILTPSILCGYGWACIFNWTWIKRRNNVHACSCKCRGWWVGIPKEPHLAAKVQKLGFQAKRERGWWRLCYLFIAWPNSQLCRLQGTWTRAAVERWNIGMALEKGVDAKPGGKRKSRRNPSNCEAKSFHDLSLNYFWATSQANTLQQDQGVDMWFPVFIGVTRFKCNNIATYKCLGDFG